MNCCVSACEVLCSGRPQMFCTSYLVATSMTVCVVTSDKPSVFRYTAHTGLMTYYFIASCCSFFRACAWWLFLFFFVKVLCLASGRAAWGVRLRPRGSWDRGFECCWGRGCSSVVFVLYVVASVRSWSLDQRSPADCLCRVWSRNIKTIRPMPKLGCGATE